MNIAAVLRELMAAGLSGEALVEAVERIESAPSKSSNAARQQRYRDRQKEAQTVTRNVTSVTNVTQSTPPSFPLDGPPKDINQTPPLIPQTSPPKINPAGAKSVRGTRLPTDFAMPADWLDWAVVDRGWQQFDATEEAAAFVDFWHAKAGANGCKLDWQATWRNWCRNSRRQSNAKRNGSICGNGQPGRGGNVRVNAALDLHAEALERERREAEGVIEGDGDYWGIGAAVSALQ